MRNGPKLIVLLILLTGVRVFAAETNEITTRLHSLEEGFGQLDAKSSRQMNELLWRQRLEDIAIVDKVNFTGPPVRGTNGIAPQSGSNDVVISALTFMPRGKWRTHKLPLIVLAHPEIHGNVASDDFCVVVRELLQQRYAVIAPDYRGSSGYGIDFWRTIDYGGLEVEDVHAARQFMLNRYREIDPKRVGMVGWSHGGLIALLTVMRHPQDYQACYAGVPVSDLEERIRIKGKGYEELFSAAYHIGKKVAEAPEEYRWRSPAKNVDTLRTPLLVQANTNDEDVNIHEIQKLIEALKAARKDFKYHIYTNAPGGHLFNRLDTNLARDSREEIWRFLQLYLKP